MSKKEEALETLKGKIGIVVVSILDDHSDEEIIDILLTEGVMAVVENEKAFDLKEMPIISDIPAVDTPATHKPIQYIGKRAGYSDGNYGSGDWVKDQVKLVAIASADKMLQHPDVYAKGVLKDTDRTVPPVKAPKGPMQDDDETLEEGRAAINAMGTKKAISEFVANNFGGQVLSMKKNDKVADYRAEAIRMIDQFHLPK